MIINKKHSLFFCAMALVYCTQHLTADEIAKTKPCSCTFPGMQGTFPQKFCDAVRHFAHPQAGRPVKPATRRMILHGPPGNGKTTFARAFAKASQSSFISLNAASIVDQYQGSGAQKIIEVFEQIDDLIRSGKRVTLLLDEIDALVSKNTPDSHADTIKAMQQLWTELDARQYNKNLFVIVATNHKQKLNKTFRSRFSAKLIQEMKNPTLEQRQEIIKERLIESYMPTLDEDELNAEFLNKLRELGIDNNTNELIDTLQHKLGILNKSIQSHAHNTTKERVIHALGTEIATLRKQAKTIDSQTASESDKKIKLIINHYCDALEEHIENARNYFALPAKQEIKPELITHLAASTDGFSIRSLVYLIDSIVETADDRNNGTITQEIINTEFTEYKNLLNQEIPERDETWRQQADDYAKLLNLEKLFRDLKCPIANSLWVNSRHKTKLDKMLDDFITESKKQ